ncbi:DUF1569 domain-containing protein [Salinimicrobium sp. TH3]|uniref:DUF1569 domain-containing protein n=1 Tax=Salinimicrobium sp. TH3 TaxID=2997342 RepID=UPI002276F722|nr:DUF1569 domain-containing protein [Salinimicrobium sp. TH3]MCY2687051.1 DUF1569 domain-containing protein [Salinimicrobium sp. TH3]
MKAEVLQAQLKEMQDYIKYNTQQNSEVSGAPVGWHLAHNLKVIHSILGSLDISDPARYQWKFSWKKELVYLTGKIPRGKARSPKKVIPEENVSAEELQDQISRASRKITGISKLPKNAFFEHPYFGHIKRDETTKFLVIHTEHHLKIIRDILGDRTK